MWPTKQRRKEKLMRKAGKLRNKIEVIDNKVKNERDTIKISELYKKRKQLMEEINKMVKLALKDGKLQKAEDKPAEVPVQQPQQVVEAIPVEQPTMEQMAQPQVEENPFDGPQLAPPQREMPQSMQPIQSIQPMPPMPQDMQPQMPPMPEQMQQMPQEEMPPMQEQMQQPMPIGGNPMYPQPQQPQQMTGYPQQGAQQDIISIIIHLVEGRNIPLDVPAQNVDNVFKKLSEGMDSQTTVQIETLVLNGRHIIYYEFT